MPESFGEAYFETARDKLIVLLNELMNTMAGGYDPTFTSVLDGHEKVVKAVNAVSIGLVNANEEWDAANNNSTVNTKIMEFSIRVHTAYIGGIMQDVTNSRLLNSVIEKIKRNTDLDDQYRVHEMGVATNEETFRATLGGQVTFIIHKPIIHTQES